MTSASPQPPLDSIPALRPVIRVRTCRRSAVPATAGAFARWLAQRWELPAATPRPARRAFLKRARHAAPSFAFSLALHSTWTSLPAFTLSVAPWAEVRTLWRHAGRSGASPGQGPETGTASALRVLARLTGEGASPRGTVTRTESRYLEWLSSFRTLALPGSRLADRARGTRPPRRPARVARALGLAAQGVPLASLPDFRILGGAGAVRSAPSASEGAQSWTWGLPGPARGAGRARRLGAASQETSLPSSTGATARREGGRFGDEPARRRRPWPAFSTLAHSAQLKPLLRQGLAVSTRPEGSAHPRMFPRLARTPILPLRLPRLTRPALDRGDARGRAGAVSAARAGWLAPVSLAFSAPAGSPPPPVTLTYARLETAANKTLSGLVQDVERRLREHGTPVVAAAPPEVDVRQLTRRVYNEFERELRIERERRGR